MDPKDAWREDVKELNAAIERLRKDIELLRGDVRRVGERLVAGSWEEDPAELLVGRKGPRSFPAMFDELRGFRNLVNLICGYVGKIANTLDVIENDVVSREEMKKHFKTSPRGRDGS